MYRLGDTICYEFATHHPTTGAATDADALPTAVLLRNNADSGETVAVTDATGDGLYTASVAIPDGWTIGDTLQLRITATVAAVAANRHSEVWPIVADMAAVKVKTDLLGTASASISYTYSISSELSQTLYCDATDIDDLYGVANTAKWADLDGDGDSDKIAARKLRAIAHASAYIESRLRGGRHTIPLSGVDVTVVDIAAALAGGWLHDARQVEDDKESGNTATLVARRAEKLLDAILAGTLRLNCELASGATVSSPFVRR